MGKILIVVLALALVGGVAYFAVTRGGPRSAAQTRQLQQVELPPEVKDVATTPKERLDAIQTAAERLGDEAQKNADRAAEVQ